MNMSPQSKRAERQSLADRLNDMVLFLLSPVVGLYYAVLLPGKLFQLAMKDMKANAADSKTADHR
jgi:hypothetical protein